MSKEILIEAKKGELQVAITDNGHLDDFHIEADRYQSLLGNIYKGRVESILPSINAAFVNIGQERNGFLYLTDVVEQQGSSETNGPKKFLERIFRKPKKNEPHKKHEPSKQALPFTVGQEILVQVVKDPFGEKGARLTTHVSLPGRFVVYMPYDKQTGVSKKIDSQEERIRLREVVKEGFTFAKTGGFIIRTASHQQGKKELIRDAKFLYGIWEKVQKKSDQEKAPAVIYEEGELTWKVVRDYLSEKVDRVVIDNEEEFNEIKKFVQMLIGPEMVDKIELYRGEKSLFESKNISKELQKIYDTHIYARSGCYVVIQQTEGLTVIDVNSGKFKPKASPGDAAFMVNMEVIPDIARQLRLRDLGGIIVIDFIDMVKEEHKRKVTDALQRALGRDPAKTEVYKISPLGLVEMTRARTGKTIESMTFHDCPYCDGRGRVKTA